MNSMKVLVDASLLIYLNVPLDEDKTNLVESFWKRLIEINELYTDMLIIDEVLYVSKKKYNIEYTETFEFLDNVVIPFVEILEIDSKIYSLFKLYLINYKLKPSDAIHAAIIKMHKLDAIVSEDKDYDIVGIKRIWL
jgi:predicted nucleic acid-binding protein